MKKIFLFACVAASLFAFAQGVEDEVVTSIEGVDVREPCQIIISIAQQSENGAWYFPNKDAEGAVPVVPNANIGYYFYYKNFDDVEYATDYWEKHCISVWDAYATGATVQEIGNDYPIASLGAVCWAFHYNTEGITHAYAKKMVKMTQAIQKTKASTIKSMQEKLSNHTATLENVTKRESKLSEQLDRLRNSLNGKVSDVQSAVNGTTKDTLRLQGELAAIQERLMNLKGETVEQVQAEFNAKLAEVQNRALQAGLSRKALEEVYSLMARISPTGDAIPPQAISYSNQIARLNVYLGYDGSTKIDPDSGEASKEDENDGTFHEPEKADGTIAENINDYLNSKGVVVATPDDSSEYENRFIINTNSGNAVSASFSAPQNWADGTTIVVTNGHFKLNGGTVWTYYDGAFHDCACSVGNVDITQASMPWLTVGSVYAIIDYSNPLQPTMSLSSTSSAQGDNQTSRFIGRLAVSGDGAIILRSGISQPITIICYQ